MKKIKLGAAVCFIIAIAVLVIGGINIPIQGSEYTGSRKNCFELLAYSTTMFLFALFFIAALSMQKEKK